MKNVYVGNVMAIGIVVAGLAAAGCANVNIGPLQVPSFGKNLTHW